MSERPGAGGTALALAVCAILAGTSVVQATPAITALTPSLAAPQPVGTNITWTTTATDTDPGTLAYRYWTKLPGTANPQIVRDLHPSNTFQWTPSMTEGTYTIQVTVQNLTTKKGRTLSVTYGVTPVATTSTGPVASHTAHPLVALYSAPPCPVGSTMVVGFKPVGTAAKPKLTNQRKCTGTSSMNFYIAGMAPSTPYLMVHQVLTGGNAVSGPNVYFRSGSIPANITAITPVTNIVRPVDSLTSTVQDMILMDYLSPGGTAVRIPILVNLNGTTIWYYPALPPQFSRYFIRPVAGGTFLITLEDPTITVPNTLFQASQILREFDLAGNTVRETNVTTVAAQLAAKYPSWNICGWSSETGCTTGQTAMLDFHHDAQRLPNGHTIVLMTAEKLFTDGTQGGTVDNPVDIIADMVIDLDTNLQVAWAWNGYLEQDLTRPAVLAETCTAAGGGCPPINFLPIANDWTHSNSLHYHPSDGSILISQRNQDFVLKIAYGSGSGDGHIVWRLGKDGDFTMTGTGDPYPWFSHQHHAGYDVLGEPVISLFDNANTRVAPPPVGLGSGNSRGWVANVDETNMTVTPTLLADLGNYSFAVGSAQRLNEAGPNYAFGSGIVNPGPSGYSQSIEVLGAPAVTGTLNYTLQAVGAAYRTYRLSSLYAGFTR